MINNGRSRHDSRHNVEKEYNEVIRNWLGRLGLWRTTEVNGKVSAGVLCAGSMERAAVEVADHGDDCGL